MGDDKIFNWNFIRRRKGKVSSGQRSQKEIYCKKRNHDFSLFSFFLRVFVGEGLLEEGETDFPPKCGLLSLDIHVGERRSNSHSPYFPFSFFPGQGCSFTLISTDIPLPLRLVLFMERRSRKNTLISPPFFVFSPLLTTLFPGKGIFWGKRKWDFILGNSWLAGTAIAKNLFLGRFSCKG